MSKLEELIKSRDVIEGKIKGVLYRELKTHSDDRGFLIEVAKQDELFIPVMQTTYTLAHPGVIKAFHWHKFQTDLWFGCSGRARAILRDIREESPTKGVSDIFYLGEPNYSVLLIPPGIAHGYQVIGNKDFLLFYHTNKSYNSKNPDEQRLPFDEFGKEIWEVKNK